MENNGFTLKLQQHENRLYVIQSKYMRGIYTQIERDAALRAEFSAWFDINLYEYQDARGYTLRKPTAEDRKQYDNQPGFPLHAILIYRNHEIPMYDDDAGQQVFAIYNNETISGGAYNLSYCETFANTLDSYFDQEYLQEIEKANV